jgi:OFA family oxalate/formate antiporter-like MFS transporter
MGATHWSETSVQLNFTITLFFLGVGTIVGGMWQDRVGPRRVASTAAILYGMGYVIAGIATMRHMLAGVYIGYGLVSGLAMGMGYICPIATLVKWFPDRRGLMTGMAVCGYGFGAVVMSPFATWEMLHFGVPATFCILGIIFLVVVLLAAQFFVDPPAGWRPHGWEPRTAVSKAASNLNFTIAEASRTWQFYFLLLLLFLNMSSGIMVISQASPMAEEIIGMSPMRAAGVVGLMSIFNGLGRIFWSTISDYIGRAPVYLFLYLLQAGVYFVLPGIHHWALFSAALAIIGLCYGGGFGTMPSFAADYFGTKFIGGIYGIVMFAANLSAIPAPLMIAHVHETAGSYYPAIHVMRIVMLCSMALPLFARRPEKKDTAATHAYPAVSESR